MLKHIVPGLTAGHTGRYNAGMATLQDLIDAAQLLPADERSRLIEALWDTMTPEDWYPPSAEWIAESQRRSDEHDAGRMTDSPWSEVRDRARRKAGMDG